jgi:hypothetical protein
MGSLIDELQRREATVRAQAEELRGQIAYLAEQLAGVEAQLARLVTAREVVDEVLDRPAGEIAPVSVAVQAAVPAGPVRRPAAAGVLAVPPWREGLGADVLPRDYRDLVEVAEDAGRPLRAVQFAAAAGLSTERGKAVTLRAKLKRLAERGWLAEQAGPGLFGVPARNGSGVAEAVKAG